MIIYLFVGLFTRHEECLCLFCFFSPVGVLFCLFPPLDSVASYAFSIKRLCCRSECGAFYPACCYSNINSHMSSLAVTLFHIDICIWSVLFLSVLCLLALAPRYIIQYCCLCIKKKKEKMDLLMIDRPPPTHTHILSTYPTIHQSPVSQSHRPISSIRLDSFLMSQAHHFS